LEGFYFGENMKIAFATDNGKNFMDRHFGDALHYIIYEINSDSSKKIDSIENDTEEEEGHADPKKAKNITNLLKDKDVQVVVSKIFGPNIKRIKSKFVCVLIKEETIEDAIIAIKKNISLIQKEWKLGEDRNFLKL
jgi:predicted Fe-Mo cluster-binding NifX family protein